MPRIAVDFGTSNTVLARIDRDAGVAETIEVPGISRPLRYRLRSTGEERCVHVVPSVIHYNEREVLIGKQVVDRGLLEHRDTIRWIKRRIAMRVEKRKKTARGLIRPATAGSDFLRTLLSYLADEISLADDEFTFTAPVEAFEDFEDWLRRVAEELGIRRLRLVDEATACILGYEGKIRGADRYVVFDFGCGTLDVAAVRIDPDLAGDRKAVQLGQAGRDLGGLDIDTWLLDDFCRQHGIDSRARRRLEPRLASESERVKIELSDPRRSESEFRFRLDSASGSVRDEACDEACDEAAGAEELRTTYRRSCPRCAGEFARGSRSWTPGCLGCILDAKEFLPRVRETVDRALDNAALKAGMRREDITRLVATGGTSLVPCVRRYLEESFGERVHYGNPFDAVVRGAARGLVVPSLQHDYAIESFDRRKRDYQFKSLFKRGTEYPTDAGAVRLWARGSYDGMTRIGIKVFEVSGMKRRTLDVSLVDGDGALQDASRVRTDLEYICLNRDNPTFILADPPVALARDEKRFLCSFRVDADRRLVVTVEDRLAGKVLLEERAVVRL